MGARKKQKNGNGIAVRKKNRSKLTTRYIASYAATEVGHIKKKAMHYEMGLLKKMLI